MFSNDPDYGLNAFDNSMLVKSTCNWLLEPVEVSTIIDWLVARMTRLEERLHFVKKKCDLLGHENEKLKKQVYEMQSIHPHYPVLKDGDVEDVD